MNRPTRTAIALCASVVALAAATGDAGAELGSTATVNGAAPPADP